MADGAFELPISVHAYCTDLRIRSAVDVLLSGKAPAIPEGTTWEELPRFFEACAAASQVKYHYAQTLHALWTGIWGAPLATWTRSTIRQQSTDSGFKVDPQSLWSNREYCRDVFKGDAYLETQVELLPDDGIRIGIARYDDSEETPLPTTGYELVNGWLCTPFQRLPSLPTLDISDLRESAVRLVALAEAA